jgi:hypothetical protein
LHKLEHSLVEITELESWGIPVLNAIQCTAELKMDGIGICGANSKIQNTFLFGS